MRLLNFSKLTFFIIYNFVRLKKNIIFAITNEVFYNQYRIIRKINKIKPDDFILVYSYKNLIKLKHKNSLYILYGNTQIKRACIFYNGKCVVSYRPIESRKLFEKYFKKYLVETK